MRFYGEEENGRRQKSPGSEKAKGQKAHRCCLVVFMLSKNHRLKKRDVLATLKKGRRFFVNEGTFIVAPNQTKIARIAIVVGKKIIKTAVGRNRTKRQYYAAFTLFLPELQGKDCVFIVKGKKEISMASHVDSIKRAIFLINKN